MCQLASQTASQSIVQIAALRRRFVYIREARQRRGGNQVAFYKSVSNAIRIGMTDDAVAYRALCRHEHKEYYLTFSYQLVQLMKVNERFQRQCRN